MKALNLQDKLLYGIGILGVLALFFMTSTNPFFWDTIQFGSEHPSYFYSVNLNGFLLPNEIDSGHVPTFGWYIAAMWTIFGKSVLVSHLALFPFVIGIIWQLINLANYYSNVKYCSLVFLLLLAEPTLLAQITLVSPDVCLFFFFTLGLNSINKQNNLLLSISILGLMITSNRGAMVGFCLFLYHAFLIWKLYGKSISKFIKNAFGLGLLYVPGAFIFIAYQSYHYIKTGWIGYHEDMTWAQCFEPVDFMGFLKNIGVYGWRMLDFGKFAIWIVLLLLIFKNRNHLLQKPKTIKLFALTIIFLLVLPLNMLWAKNLLAHRYLLPSFLVISLITVHLLLKIDRSIPFKKGILLGIICSLLVGNFYIYPDKISQGWDSSLAYLPYFNLKNKMIAHVEHEKIDPNEISAFFPSQGSLELYKLNNDERFFTGFTGTEKYVIYSNINNVNDHLLLIMEQDYFLKKEFKSNGIFYRLYERRKNNG